jgi:predicted nucleic acid-binding Zn ribbon protein
VVTGLGDGKPEQRRRDALHWLVLALVLLTVVLGSVLLLVRG